MSSHWNIRYPPEAFDRAIRLDKNDEIIRFGKLDG